MKIRCYLIFLLTCPVVIIKSGFSQVPTITGFSPTSGAVNTTVIITGSNFNATPTNNIVYFGTIKAIPTAASTTSLTVAVPAGASYQPITVLSGGMIAYSPKSFLPTFGGDGTGISANTLSAKTDFASGTKPRSVAMADVDGDGKADLITTNESENTISVLRNNSTAGTISYASKIDFNTGSQPWEAAFGDFDRDGKLDIAVTNVTSNTISVFRNTSTGVGSVSFAAKVDFSAGNPISLVINDFDLDGRPDLAVANALTHNISVLRNISSSVGMISFDVKVDFLGSMGPRAISAGDVDGDGKADLFVANLNTNTVSIYRNTSTGPGVISYASKIDFDVTSSPRAVLCGDMDGDNKPDLAVVNGNSNTVSILRNISTGIGSIDYSAKIDFATGQSPQSVSLADMDGDGRLDMAVVNRGNSTSVSLFSNISSGPGVISYNSKVDFTTGLNPRYVTAGDLDGDGKVDIAVANETSDNVSVFRNLISSSSTTPTITNINPSSGLVGTNVTITGTNFSTIAANNIVKFNGTSASVVGTPTATSLIATVPAGATTGKITVEVNGQTAVSPIDFTLISPTISGINPSEGLVGANVTITGTNFSTVAINNIVKFNGASASVVGTPTATSLIATVPAGATTGKITVEVNGQTAVSPIDFTVTPFPPIEITSETLPSSYTKGGSLTVNIIVSDASRVSSVTLKTRGISETQSAYKGTLITASGNVFEKVIGASDLIDPIGLEYYFEVVDSNENIIESNIGTAYINYVSSASDIALAGLTFGDKISNYQIISIPLILANKDPLSVFKDLGVYNKKLWRLFDYSFGEEREYPGFSSIDAGKGYWLIVRNSTTINPGAGMTVTGNETNPFTITLNAGWNLIGNPYNFRISWADVLAANGNPSAISDKLKVFSNGNLTDALVLDRFRGGFVFNNTTSNIQIKIPVLRNTSIGGRKRSDIDDEVDVTSKKWQLGLILSDGKLRNELGGIGMNPDATFIGKDKFDEVSVPLPDGLNFFEILFNHPELKTDFNKEVVPLQDNHVWKFEVSNLTGNSLILEWNSNIKLGGKQLVLLNPITLELVNMETIKEYSISPNTKELKIIYGDAKFVDAKLDEELPLLGSVFPNPGNNKINVSFRVKENILDTPILIKVLNAQGVEVAELVNNKFPSGNHLVEWIHNEASGMYIIEMRVAGVEIKRVKLLITE